MVTERGRDRALDRPIIFFLPLLLLVLLVLWPGSLAMHRPVYEACSTHIIVPGKKGERGILGETGVPGKPGQIGPSGTKGRAGENGEKGELGRPGKIGPMGAKGDEGRNGEQGLPGVKGERGVPCDCDKMRKVVGELDITVEKLRDQVHFLKSAVVGMIESERRLYLLVREEKRFAEAKKHCQERGGWLAMPHDEVSNELLASYVTRAGLTRVFIGLFDERKEGKFSYVDGSSLGAYSRWQPGEPNNILGNENCVEMMSSGGWNNVDCSQGLYFVCEFEKLDTWVV